MSNSINEIDSWFESSGETENNVFFIRGRKNLGRFMDSGKFPSRIDVIWEFESIDGSGLPTEMDNLRMMEMEDLLTKEMETDFHGVLAGVFTGSGHREWFWYTREREEYMERFNKAVKSLGSLPIEIYHEPDNEWQEYADMMDAFGIPLA